jgi:tryptophan synthase alpha chain
MPFSDPLADGPTIQRAAERSLSNGTTVGRCLQAAGEIRVAAGAPVVLMGYYNPVRRYGVGRFCAAAAAAGVSGLILPDLPPEEAEETLEAAEASGLDIIFLLAPTSTDARIERAARLARGFVYCVSLTGVTGARASVAQGLGAYLARVRRHTSLPLAVGFGVSTPEHAREVGRVADGVVVASALIDLLDTAASGERDRAAEGYARSLRAAMDTARSRDRARQGEGVRAQERLEAGLEGGVG